MLIHAHVCIGNIDHIRRGFIFRMKPMTSPARIINYRTNLLFHDHLGHVTAGFSYNVPCYLELYLVKNFLFDLFVV